MTKTITITIIITTKTTTIMYNNKNNKNNNSNNNNNNNKNNLDKAHARSHIIKSNFMLLCLVHFEISDERAHRELIMVVHKKKIC